MNAKQDHLQAGANAPSSDPQTDNLPPSYEQAVHSSNGYQTYLQQSTQQIRNNTGNKVPIFVTSVPLSSSNTAVIGSTSLYGTRSNDHSSVYVYATPPRIYRRGYFMFTTLIILVILVVILSRFRNEIMGRN